MLYRLAECKRQIHRITYFETVAVEITCTMQHTNHIEDAVAALIFVILMLTMLVDIMLIKHHLGRSIRIPHLIHRMSVAFTSPLAEIKRYRVWTGITQQSITKNKKIVHTTVTACHQTGAIGRTAVIGRQIC